MVVRPKAVVGDHRVVDDRLVPFIQIAALQGHRALQIIDTRYARRRIGHDHRRQQRRRAERGKDSLARKHDYTSSLFQSAIAQPSFSLTFRSRLKRFIKWST